MEESFKRSRTSPRVNVINEVQAVMVPHMDAITNILTRAYTVGVEGNIAEMVGEHLTAIRTGVEALREGHPKVSKEDTSASVSKKDGGTHFVGVKEDGSALYVRWVKDPGGYLGDDGELKLSQVYGPFNTRAGAEYAAAHGTYSNRPQVM
jgi:hypothetical protein